MAGLIDARPPTFDNKDPHPLLGEVDAYMRGLDWVRTAGARTRDEGQVFHLEGFGVPRTAEAATPQRVEAARQDLFDLDWKLRDVVIIPVARLSGFLEAGDSTVGRR